ncbi:MAG TPA: ABC transporter permease [Stellaceae bacterium]|nr:ABC transporter permease [Stellaceae bacterium]
MKLNRIRAIAVKEALQIWRDPRSLMIALAMPFMQMCLLGYGVSVDIKHIPVCVWDQQANQDSQDLLKRFQSSQYFQVVGAFDNARAVTAAIDDGRCRVALVIPPDFSARLGDSSRSAVQALIDATDDNTANIAIGYAQAIVSAYSADAWSEALSRRGVPALAQPVALESRVWFNEALESRNFIVPGIVAIVMALVGAQLTSLTISREWERGTMELLVSTPVTPLELMIGKLAPYFGVGMLDAFFCLGLAVFWFTVPFRGALSTLLFATALFLVVVLGIGYLLSVLIRSQLGASQIALLVTLLPTTMLSGYAFPIDQMPGVIQAITYLVHSRYYVTVLKAIFLKGAGVTEIAFPLAAMVVYAGLVTYLAARAFRKTVD